MIYESLNEYMGPGVCASSGIEALGSSWVFRAWGIVGWDLEVARDLVLRRSSVNSQVRDKFRSLHGFSSYTSMLLGLLPSMPHELCS